MANSRGKWKQWQILFSWTPESLDGDCSLEVKRHLLLRRKTMTDLDSVLKSRDITLLTKVHKVIAVVFQQLCMEWEFDCKVGWVLKNWCFQTVVLEKTLESPLDSKEMKAVHPKGNQPLVFIGRTDAAAEAPILWPPDVKSWLAGKVPDAEKDWGPVEKRVTEDEMVGWHQGLNGHEFEQTQGDSEGRGSLACFSPWGLRVRHESRSVT